MKQKQHTHGRLFSGEFLYEFRPIFCLAVGAYAIFHGKASPMMGICGLMLLGSGLLIYNMRKQARQRSQITFRRR